MLQVVVKGWIFVTFVVVEEVSCVEGETKMKFGVVMPSLHKLRSWFDQLMKHL